MNRITIFGEHEPNTIAQLKDVASRAERAALMADGHLGYVMPIGGVAAYRDQVSVVGVGFDIACGNAAIRTDLTSPARRPRRARCRRSPTRSRTACRSASAGRTARTMRRWIIRCSRRVLGRRAGQRATALRDKARAQLGTVGSGNHYVDVFADETGAIWVGVHFGSRGFGHTVASGFLAIVAGREVGHARARARGAAPARQPIGQDYWALMTLAGEYAYAGREWVARKVVSILGGRELELVHNHHNFAWREEHDGEPSSSSAKARRRRSPVRRASSADRWATMPSSCRAQ